MTEYFPPLCATEFYHLLLQDNIADKTFNNGGVNLLSTPWRYRHTSGILPGLGLLYKEGEKNKMHYLKYNENEWFTNS